MPDSKIAVTLFNVRDFCKTESDLDATLDKLCAIGYKVVQVSAVPLEPEVIRKQLDKHDLFCCATHESLADISGDASALADKLDILGCDFAALGAPPKEMRDDPKNFENIAAIMNRCGEKLRARGKKLGYHNHHWEFDKLGGSETMLEKILRLTDPEFVFSELDVHWVTRGGGSPVAWIRKLAGRIPVIHFKDFALVNKEPQFCEIGEGNLDWKGIIEACVETKIPFYSIEQDKCFMDRDIFTSMKISYDNLRAMGVK